MELESGAKAAYLQCHFTPDYQRNYVFIGTEGRVENSEPDGKVWVKTRKSGSWKDLADRTYDIKPLTGGHGGADPIILEDFIDTVLQDRPSTADVVDGRMAVAVGCAAAESMRTGGLPVDIPPIYW